MVSYLDWIKEKLVFWKSLVLGVFGRDFPKEISLSLSGPGEALPRGGLRVSLGPGAVGSCQGSHPCQPSWALQVWFLWLSLCPRSPVCRWPVVGVLSYFLCLSAQRSHSGLWHDEGQPWAPVMVEDQFVRPC